MNRTTSPRSAKLLRSSAETPDLIADELRRYDDHLRDVRGLAAGTRRARCRIVARLLRKKFAGSVINMAKLRPADVRRFIARQLEGTSEVRWINVVYVFDSTRFKISYSHLPLCRKHSPR